MPHYYGMSLCHGGGEKPERLFDTWLPGEPFNLAELSHFAAFVAAKSFKTSEGYPKVFTTGEGVGTLF